MIYLVISITSSGHHADVIGIYICHEGVRRDVSDMIKVFTRFLCLRRIGILQSYDHQSLELSNGRCHGYGIQTPVFCRIR